MHRMIQWMAEHPVASNLTMIFVVIVGAVTALGMPQKTFPEFTLDSVDISLSYPGASPAEIQESIVRPIEEQLAGIDGIDSKEPGQIAVAVAAQLLLECGKDVRMVRKPRLVRASS